MLNSTLWLTRVPTLSPLASPVFSSSCWVARSSPSHVGVVGPLSDPAAADVAEASSYWWRVIDSMTHGFGAYWCLASRSAVALPLWLVR